MPTKKEEVYRIFDPDPETGVSKKVRREDLKGTVLQITNGAQRHRKFYGMDEYIWNCKREKNTIVMLWTEGFDEAYDKKKTRKIRKDIRDNVLGRGKCHNCGSTSSSRLIIEMDIIMMKEF